MREYHEIRKRFFGNTKAAQSYVGLARTFLGIVKNIDVDLGNLPLSTRRLTLSNGVRIEVTSVHGQDTVEITAPDSATVSGEVECDLYVHTGRANFVTANTLSEDIYKNSNVEQGTSVAAYIGIDNQGQGEMITEGQPEYGNDLYVTYNGLSVDDPVNFNCANPSKTLTAVNPYTLNARSYTSTVAEYCSTEHGHRKLAQMVFPSSRFTGKMRLYVQSVYGSRRTDYWFVPQLVGGDLYIGGEQIDSEYGHTSVIYTDHQYNYFLFKFTGSSVWIGKMKLTTCGEALRQWLARNQYYAWSVLQGESRRVIEAYILSTASPPAQDDMDLVQTFGSATGAGAPMYYGWKANWKGDEASVVLWQYDTNQWYTHLVTVNLIDSWTGFDEDQMAVAEEGLTDWGDRFGFNESLETKGPFNFRRPYDAFWRPEPYVIGMEAIIHAPGAPMTNVTDAPLYCFYDSNDALEVVRYTYDASDYTATWQHESYPTPGLTSRPHLCGCRKFEGCAYHYQYQYRVTTKLSTDSGLSYEGYSEAGKAVDAFDGWWSGTDQRSDWEFTFYTVPRELTETPGCGLGPAFTVDCPYNGTTGEWAKWYYALGNALDMNPQSFSREWRLLLIVPYNDCEAVYIGGTEDIRDLNAGGVWEVQAERMHAADWAETCSGPGCPPPTPGPCGYGTDTIRENQGVVNCLSRLSSGSIAFPQWGLSYVTNTVYTFTGDHYRSAKISFITRDTTIASLYSDAGASADSPNIRELPHCFTAFQLMPFDEVGQNSVFDYNGWEDYFKPNQIDPFLIGFIQVLTSANYGSMEYNHKPYEGESNIGDYRTFTGGYTEQGATSFIGWA